MKTILSFINSNERVTEKANYANNCQQSKVRETFEL